MGNVRFERLPEDEKRRAADWMAEEIRRQGEFSGQGNALDLHYAAVAMTLKLVYDMEAEGEGAAYMPEEEAAAMIPAIFLTKGMTGRRRARALAHEQAHHLMRARVAPALYGADTVICMRQDNGRVRHELAQDVEDQVAE